jgi:hypothetical protein
MGRLTTELTTLQNLANKVNAKKQFTHYIVSNPQRYVVGLKNLFEGVNPSLEGSALRMAEIALGSDSDAFGGWLSEDGVYYVDLSTTTDNLHTALSQARDRGELAIWDSLKEVVINV